MPSILIGTDVFHYRMRGEDGSVAVFIHPYMLDSRFWLDQLVDLQTVRRCIAVDLRGHGHSAPLGSDEVSVLRDADDVIAILDALGVDGPVDFVGAAAGGLIAAAACSRAGNRARSLTTMSTLFFQHLDSGRKEFYLERARLLVLEGRDIMFRRLNEYILSPEASLQARARYKSMLEHTPYETLVSVLTGDALEAREDALSGVCVPLMIPIGSDDLLLSSEYLEKMRQLVADLRTIRFDAAGRLLALESPHELSRALREFWDSLN